MSRSRKVKCDGCGREEELRGSARSPSLPAGWRSLNIGRPGGGSWHADVCGPACASRAVDKTYEEEDRATLHLVGSTRKAH